MTKHFISLDSSVDSSPFSGTLRLPSNPPCAESRITDMSQDTALAFLESTVKALVDHPDDVKIVKTIDEMGVLMTLDINGEDMGKVIGRKGATAKAIRTLLRVVGMKNNARVNMKINEPAGRVKPVASDVDQAIEDLRGDLSAPQA